MGILDDIWNGLVGIPKAIDDAVNAVIPGRRQMNEFMDSVERTRGAAGREALITGVGKDLAAAQQFRVYAEMFVRSLGVVEFMRLNRAQLAKDFATLKASIAKIPFLEFREAWKVARQLIGLQGRLVMEQAFWDLGNPWKSLYTGFKAIGDESVDPTKRSEDSGTPSGIDLNAESWTSGPPPPDPPFGGRPGGGGGSNKRT